MHGTHPVHRPGSQGPSPPTSALRPARREPTAEIPSGRPRGWGRASAQVNPLLEARVSAANNSQLRLVEDTTLGLLGSVLARLPDPSTLPSGGIRAFVGPHMEIGRCHVPHQATAENQPLQTRAERLEHAQ